MRRPQLIPASSVGAVLVATSLVLAACGDNDSNDQAPASQQVAGSSEVGATWPMTGLPASGDENVAQTHPVFAVKVENTVNGAPQIGLSKADLVVEELVEGGLTRLAAFYYSQTPDRVEAVRSMRASDVGIVAPVHATLVTSGAAGRTINIIKDAGLNFVQEGAKGFSRDSSRSAPYNLVANLEEIAKTQKIKATRPADYLPWGSEDDFPKGKPAKTIAATFSGGHTSDWTYDGKGYVNDNTNAAKGDEFPADSVLVLRVQVGDAGYLDPAGNPVPETKFTGTGAAMLFHDGRVVRGTWKKSALDAPISLSMKSGKLTVPAGHTWIELVPANGGNVTFTKK